MRRRQIVRYQVGRFKSIVIDELTCMDGVKYVVQYGEYDTVTDDLETAKLRAAKCCREDILEMITERQAELEALEELLDKTNYEGWLDQWKVL